MANEIKVLLGGIPDVRADWKEDWKEDTKADWKVDWDAVAGQGTAPANTVAPAITGTAQVGETLTVSSGTWTGSPTPTITYQWRVDGVDVAGATTSTYEVQPEDEGLIVQALVTATNSVGTAFVMPATSPVLAAV